VALVRVSTRLLSATHLTTAHPSAERVRDVLERTDIVNRVKIVQAYLLEVTDSRWLNDRASVRLASDGVRHVIDQLQRHMDALHAEYEAHAARYFASWHSPDVDRDLAAIAMLAARLHDRMTSLREVTALAAVQQPRKQD